MRLTRDHVDAFVAMSHDRNPLHVDAAYARRTPFGRPVVHGVAALLCALGAWARGRRFALRALRASFRRPVYVDQDYELVLGDGELELVRGGDTVLTAELSAAPLADPPATPPASEFQPRHDAAGRVLPRHIDVFPYAADMTRSRLATFGLDPDQLPPHQVATLSWASYFVGMEFPGRQALFSDLEVGFSAAPALPFAMHHLELRHEPAFRRSVITGSGTGVASIRIVAFERPAAVDHDLEQVRAALGESARLAGKTVLVTGASRGFGAVLARGFALHGADVALNARAASEDLTRVAEDVARCGRRPRLAVGDVGDAQACTGIAEALGGLDLLCNNATAPIPAQDFLAAPLDEWSGFVGDALRMVAAPCRALLPRMRPGGTVVNVSSSFVRLPERGLSSYVAAKSAIEGLTRALAREHPRLAFVIARPPPMLTDQTSTVVKLRAMASALSPARALLDALAGLPATPNLHEIDL